MPKHGLGRGLISLIPKKINKEIVSDASATPGSLNEEKIIQIPIDQIRPNPHQPRKDFSQEGLEELAESIREHGIIQPLIVTKVGSIYQIITGERRWRAAKIIMFKTIPAIVRNVERHKYLELALIENIQRKNLNAIEEAFAYKRLIDEFNITQDELARRVGKSRPVITNAIRLLSLPQEIQKAVIEEKISFTTARIIAGLPQEEQLNFFYKALKDKLPVSLLEERGRKITKRFHKPHDKDPYILAKEETLQQILNTMVKIRKSGSAGKIIISFFSEEEFEDIFKKICNQPFK